MTHTHIKTAIMIGALAALVAPCAAQGSFDSWAAGGYAGQSTNGAADAFFGYVPGPGRPPVVANRQPPVQYQAPNPYSTMPRVHYAPESAARTTQVQNRPAPTVRPPATPYTYSHGYPATALPGPGAANPGLGYGYPGLGHYGHGLSGYGPSPNYGIPPYGGNLPGLGYPGLGGLHTPGLYGNPYLGAPALLQNPYATGVPGLYGLGPYGL